MATAAPNYQGKVVLITGGTRGIGLATARAFAAHGAHLIVTHAWGSADEDEVRTHLCGLGASSCLVAQADISREEDTADLMAEIAGKFSGVDCFISNASVSLVVNDFEDYSERGFLKSMRGSAWPAFAYMQAIKERFGRHPRYVIQMSSDGPDRFTPGYDFVAAGKAAAETMVRYLAYRLRGEGVRINTLRSRAIKTESFDSTFGSEFHDFLGSFVPERWFIKPEEVGNAAFALCSGLCDHISGQTIMIDRGSTFFDGISYLYERRDELGL